MARPIRPFRFKQFEIHHDRCAMKVGTDGVLLGAWVDVQDDKTLLDVGTGSGLIAIMMAQKNTIAQIKGIEIDANATSQAQGNALGSPWGNRIQIEHTSLQDFTQSTHQTFDHIVSNPPYFETNASLTITSRNQARQTHTLTFSDLIAHSKKILHENGRLSVILPTLEMEQFIQIALAYDFYVNRKLLVHPKQDKPVERVLCEFGLTKGNLQEESLIIQHEARNDWTADYIALTKNFYLKM